MRGNMSSFIKSTSNSSCSENDSELRRGPWTLEEDTVLIHYIARHGEGRWNLVAKRSGLQRTGKSCRLRWLNYLKPDVKRGNLTPQEQITILELHSKWGNRWSKIAQHLPGRTDNEIKNYWRTRVQKQARHLKIDANSTAFQEVIRCFWMPRLLQKMDGSSSASLTVLSQNSTVSDQSFDLANIQQYSAISALPQVSVEQAPIDMRGKVQRFDHQELNSSDSEHGTATSCISSSESMNISQISQFSDYPTSPFAKDFCPFDNSCYNMETINQPENIPATAEDFGNPVCGFQMGDDRWVEYDIWNLDELWQFRNSIEKGTYS